MNNREGKTRIDIATGGLILLWEIGEITTDILLDSLKSLLDDFIFTVQNKQDTYYKKVIKELLDKELYIEAHSA